MQINKMFRARERIRPHFFMIALLAILASDPVTLAAAAAQTTGNVIAVRGDTVIFEVTAGPNPSIGDLVEVSFELGGEKFHVGTWRISRFVGPVIEASKVKAQLDPEKGMSVLVRRAPAGRGNTARRQAPRAITTAPRRTPAAITITTVSTYRLVWKDKGSGADRDFAVWRPVGRNGFYPLGDVANASPWHGKRYHQPGFQTLMVRGGKAPVGYRRVWNTERSHPRQPFSSWAPVAPPDYVCLGHVGNTGLDAMPPLDAVRCLPRRCVVETSLEQMIWKDTGSGARLDFSAWLVPGVNVYIGHAAHKRPRGVFHTINPACL